MAAVRGTIGRILAGIAGIAFGAGFVVWPLVDDARWIVVGGAVALALGIVGAVVGVPATKVSDGPGDGVAP